MFGILSLLIATFFTWLVVWKRITLFAVAAGGFWVAFMAYMLDTYVADAKMQLIVGGLAAVVGGIALYGLYVDGSGTSGFRRMISRFNNDKYEYNRPHTETLEEYQSRVNKALHPRRIKR